MLRFPDSQFPIQRSFPDINDGASLPAARFLLENNIIREPDDGT